MTRAFVIVLDSLGVGELPDAAAFGDAGAHTLNHIAASRPLAIPRLVELGLGHVPSVEGILRTPKPHAATGRLAEASPGKDTSTGHWEMMGCVLDQAFPVFEDGFPPAIIDPFVELCGIPGVLENGPASGTEVIERLGQEHIDTGKPIVYTSADSVFQVAAHMDHYGRDGQSGLERLLEHCRIAREILDPYGVGRVIARPFKDAAGFKGAVGAAAQPRFQRTYDRRDFSLQPPVPTSMDRLKAAGHEVIGVGKIEDIFAGRGVTRSVHTEGNRDGMQRLNELARELDAGFVFVNLVDFDMLFGHRRDVEGYAKALVEFDKDLVAFEAELREGDLVILTADHGNDPTHPIGTDHTREHVPVIAWRHGQPSSGTDLGTRASFADIGATIETAFGLEPPVGASFLDEL